MSISKYLKIIGRGKDGARPLSREDAADLFGQVLDGSVTDLEVGGFCLAMRIKGETPEEMAGFLDATHQRMNHYPASSQPGQPTVVLPTYNGARKLPVLTPLLALLLARRGAAVLIHGTATESFRVFTADVLANLDIPAQTTIRSVAPGEVVFAPTELLLPSLKRLLDVRRAVGLRNPAHSLVKLMNPCHGEALVVSSYTHPDYAVSMGRTFELTQANALLLRGTEGEVVADPRRLPQMEAFIAGVRQPPQPAQTGTLAALPDLPKSLDAATTAAFTRAVMAGDQPVPTPIALQVEYILRVASEVQLTRKLISP